MWLKYGEETGELIGWDTGSNFGTFAIVRMNNNKIGVWTASNCEVVPAPPTAEAVEGNLQTSTNTESQK